MSQLNYRPVAAPVDTFAAPEVRQPEIDNTFAQFAFGLTQFQRGAEVLGDSIAAGDRRNQIAGAQQLVNEHSIRSMDQFDQAVRDGKIKADANPWQRIFVGALVGGVEVRNRALELQQAYSSGEAKTADGVALKDIDDLKAVEAYMSEGLAPLFEKRSPWELEQMHGEAQRASSDIVQAHEKMRSAEREKEARGATARSLQDNIQSILQAPTEALRDARIQTFNGLIANGSKTVGESAIRDGVVTAMLASAENSDQLAEMRKILDTTELNGKPLSFGVLESTFRARADALDEREYHKLVRGQAQEEKDLREQSRIVQEQILSAWDLARTNGVSFDPINMLTNVPPAVRANVLGMLQGMSNAWQSDVNIAASEGARTEDLHNTRLATDIFNGIVRDVSADRLKGNALQDRLAWTVTALGLPGQKAVAMYQSIQSSLNKSAYAQETPPEVKAQIARLAFSDQTTENKVGEINALVASGQVSLQDTNQFYENLRYFESSRGHEVAAVLRAQIDAGKRQIAAAFEALPEALDANGRLTPFYATQVELADAEMVGVLQKRYADNAGAPIGALTTDFQTSKEEIVKRYGGLTLEEMQKQKPVSDALSRFREGAKGAVTFQGGKFFTVTPEGPKEYFGGLRILTTEADFSDARKVNETAQRLGITDPKEKQKFVEQQAAQAGPAAVALVKNKYEDAQLNDPDAVSMRIVEIEAEMAQLEAQYMRADYAVKNAATEEDAELAAKLRRGYIRKRSVLEQRLEGRTLFYRTGLRPRLEKLLQKQQEDTELKARIKAMTESMKPTNAK